MRFLIVLGLLVSFVTGVLHAHEHPEIEERPDIIKALDGEWVMVGDVLGEPVSYRMTAKATLQGAFTEIHMNDSQVPSEYEARVFIGYDADSETVVVHWMDSFGAKYSIPHGTGHITSDAIQFTIPYETGAFRDTFKYDPETETWFFILEAYQPDGTWKHFARYEVQRN
jgi:hypothetical protein